MKSLAMMAAAGCLVAALAACTEVPVYPDPAYQPAPVAYPPADQSNYGNTTLPVAPLVPTPEGAFQNPQSYNTGAPSGGGALNSGTFDQRPVQITPAPRPSLSSDSRDYSTDPRLPSNRGQWETVRGPNGQPMRVYSTDVDRHAPDAVHRTDLPAGSGFQPADTRWDPQRR